MRFWINIIIYSIVCLLTWGIACTANARSACSDAKDDTAEPLTVEQILERLGEKKDRIHSYHCRLEYLFIQEPELLDSRTLRKGHLYYIKEENGSKLRVNFETLKQDHAPVEKYIEQFVFDGIWLTRIDYQLEKTDYYEQAPADKPLDVFEFISHRFPIVGFTNPQMLKEQFDIATEDSGPGETICLKLTVKKDSIYTDDYKTIDFLINRKTFLPARVVATSVNDDVYNIIFTEPVVNERIGKDVFEIKVPENFEKNRYLLEHNEQVSAAPAAQQERKE